MFGSCARREAYILPGLQGVLAVMVSIAGARTVGLLVDGEPNLFMIVLLAAEGSMAIVVLIALRRAVAAPSR